MGMGWREIEKERGRIGRRVPADVAFLLVGGER